MENLLYVLQHEKGCDTVCSYGYPHQNTAQEPFEEGSGVKADAHHIQDPQNSLMV